jgi:hypothetical protein
MFGLEGQNNHFKLRYYSPYVISLSPYKRSGIGGAPFVFYMIIIDAVYVVENNVI